MKKMALILSLFVTSLYGMESSNPHLIEEGGLQGKPFRFVLPKHANSVGIALQQQKQREWELKSLQVAADEYLREGHEVVVVAQLSDKVKQQVVAYRIEEGTLVINEQGNLASGAKSGF